MNYNYLKIIILTQEDNFFLPYNIEKVIKEFHVLGIHIIDSKGSLNNKISDFIKWFGIKQVIKLGNKTIIKKCQSLLDRLFSFKLWNAYTSIKNIALKYGVKYCVFNKINNNEYLSYVRSLNPDLIISYSCPIVSKNHY